MLRRSFRIWNTKKIAHPSPLTDSHLYTRIMRCILMRVIVPKLENAGEVWDKLAKPVKRLETVQMTAGKQINPKLPIGRGAINGVITSLTTATKAGVKPQRGPVFPIVTGGDELHVVYFRRHSLCSWPSIMCLWRYRDQEPVCMSHEKQHPAEILHRPRQ